MKCFGWLVVSIVVVQSGWAAVGEYKLSPLGKPSRFIREDSQLGVFSTVRVDSLNGSQTLYLTGAGVREKHLAFLSFDVYAAFSYWDQKGASAAELSEPHTCSTRALKLVMLRNLSREKMVDGFKGSLKANGVSTDIPAIGALMAAIPAEVKQGDEIEFVAVCPSKPGLEQQVSMKAGGRSILVEGKGFADQFWSIWFGKPADSGLEDLKKELVSELVVPNSRS